MATMPPRQRPVTPHVAAELSDGPGLGVAAVARRLGVAAGTLRTWDRRYGLGPNLHQAGSRRRYGALDIARLDLMRRLMQDGVATADAAEAAGAASAASLAGQSEPVTPAAEPAVPVTRGRTSRPGGGRVLSTGRAGPAARGVARAAMALDADACTRLLATGIVRAGVLSTWKDVLSPVLAGVLERRRRTGLGAEVEHLLRESAETALRSSQHAVEAHPTRPARQTRPVLLAALEPEDHRLALVALGAALAEHRIEVRSFGPRLPARALADAVVRTGPSAVVLWSQGGGGGRLPEAALLAGVRPRPALVLAGPGWEPGVDRGTALSAPDLASAVGVVLAVVRGGGPGAG